MPAAARQSGGTDAADAAFAPPPETPRETSPAGLPNSPGAASQFPSTPRYPSLCFPLYTVNHSHMNALCDPTSKCILQNVQTNEKRCQDEPGGVKGRR